MTSTAVVGDSDRTVGSSGRSVDRALERIGAHALRYGLVLVLVWIGAMKFTAYEAEAIQGLVANSR